jgi:hypothetical protein
VRAPYAPRRVGDRQAQHRVGRRLKQAGLAPLLLSPVESTGPMPLPRIVVQRSRAGWRHPATKAAVVSVLRALGPRCTYGLRSVELVQGPATCRGHRLPFGRLLVPGRVQLFAQSVGAWLLAGSLPPPQADRLRRAGASLELTNGGLQTMVNWPDRTLADFMLFDVLLHELAHHAIQQYTGKRPARVARTADHEAAAERLAARWRAELEASPFRR